MLQLISAPSKDLLKKTPQMVISNKSSMTDLNNQGFDVSGLQLAVVEKQSQLPAINKAGISCIISHPDVYDASVNGKWLKS